MRQVFLNLHNKPECPLLRRSLIFWLIDKHLIVIPSMRNRNLFQINELQKVQNIILQNISLCKSLQECMYTGPRFTILPETTILKQLKSVLCMFASVLSGVAIGGLDGSLNQGPQLSRCPREFRNSEATNHSADCLRLLAMPLLNK